MTDYKQFKGAMSVPELTTHIRAIESREGFRIEKEYNRFQRFVSWLINVTPQYHKRERIDCIVDKEILGMGDVVFSGVIYWKVVEIKYSEEYMDEWVLTLENVQPLAIDTFVVTNQPFAIQ
jgi:hypothetical protein